MPARRWLSRVVRTDGRNRHSTVPAQTAGLGRALKAAAAERGRPLTREEISDVTAAWRAGL